MSSVDSIVDAGIDSLAAALSSKRLTSVDLVAKYLLRISNYDCRNIELNSIPLINENVFDEATAADDRRATGTTLGSLDGIPFTVKDSYKVKGMTVASGSEAFQRLVANEDAFTVRALRNAGAVLIGKTNMCPMAYGGMIRGLYGRAESPYNLDYLPAAFGSGSSNGSGVSTAASFAAFGMGEKTVSSGRSPASNNALIAYTPSRGLISIRGNWPLYPTCDVVVPHTRTMDDLFAVLDVITAHDPETTGDFWRDQSFVVPPIHWSNLRRPFSTIKDVNYLNGKRIAVPEMYIKQTKQGPYVSKAIEPLWAQARADLEAAGAVVEVVQDFPITRAYDELLTKGENANLPSFGLPKYWYAAERGTLIAHAWEDFLEQNNDQNYPSLTNINPKQIFPHLPPDDPQVKFTEPANAVHWSKLASYIRDTTSPTATTRSSKSLIYNVPHLEAAVKALEAIRKHYFESWLTSHKIDYVVFPAAGDIAHADADISTTSAEHAWKDGVKYSHGNRALRHVGIPSVTVPAGMLADSNMPMGLTFLGRAYEDIDLLKVAYAYEQRTKRRIPPPRTPPLASDIIALQQHMASASDSRPRPVLSVSTCTVTAQANATALVFIQGTVSINIIASPTTNGSRGLSTPAPTPLSSQDINLEIFIDGTEITDSNIEITNAKEIEDNPNTQQWQFKCQHPITQPRVLDARNKVVGKIARDSTMVMVLCRFRDGRPSGFLRVVHFSDQIRSNDIERS